MTRCAACWRSTSARSLDRNIIVENRTGGDGLIGIKAVKAANPDGTTILVTDGAHDVFAADGRDDAEF